MIRVLRQRDVALVWTAGLVSVAGDWALYAALPYLVYAATGSTLATAALVVAELVPGALLSTFTGVLADRADRRKVMAGAILAQVVIVLALLGAQDGARLWLVLTVAVLQSAAAAVAAPAEAALLPSLVREEDLVAVNALNALNNRLGRFLGLPAGAALLAWSGLPAVVVLDALTFCIAAGLVLMVRTPSGAATRSREPAAAGKVRAVRADWVAGLSLVRRDRSLAVLFVVLSAMTFGGTMLDPLFVPWVRDVLAEGPEVYALLIGTASVSGALGAVVVGSWGLHWESRSVVGLASVAAGVLLLVKFHLPYLTVALVAGAVGGLLSAASSIHVETMAQQLVPDRYRGRVFGSLQSVVWAMSLLGAVAGGVAGDLLGVLPALTVAAGVVAGSGVLVLVAVPRRSGIRSKVSANE